VAVPDNVTLFGQAGALVDVLANDVDPSGGLLSVQRAEALTDNQLDIAVVNGRWLQVSARQGQLSPNPQVIRYTITNGLVSGIPGQVVVSQRPPPSDSTPVTQNDEVTVREGSSQAIPVLDNDFSPSGGTLSLVGGGDQGAGRLDVQAVGAPIDDNGAAFVSGRTVRYVAPSGLEGPKEFTIRYQVANEQGETATGKAHVTVLPVRVRTNNPPEPPVIEGRTVSGDTIKLRLPGYGVDPDGDMVTILGLGSAPEKGSVTRIGANSIEYTAYPTSFGTDEFTYRITDTLGATSTGTARVSIAPPGPPQPPLAVPDAITVAPGRTAVVDVLANDLVAAGSRVTVSLVAPPPGVRLRSPTGPIEIDAPGSADARSVEVVYRLADGLDSSQTTITLRTQEGYNNPPIVSDAFGTAGDGRSVTADVLSAGTATNGSASGAYDPDGPFEELVVADVYAPEGISTRIQGGRVTVERAQGPMVVPFRVEDGDGGAATGSLYVPAADSGQPYVDPDAVIRLQPGQRLRAVLSDYVVNPSGGPLRFTLKSRMWASPETKLQASVTGDETFDVRAGASYEGPGAVVFEVTTGTRVDDPDGIRGILSVPVQVGVTKPILRCPDDPIDVPQAEFVRIDVAALCHVWTAAPGDVGELVWSAEFDEESAAGLSAGAPEDSVVQVNASAAAAPGDTGTLLVAADNSDPGEVRIRVIETPPPSLAPIRVASMRAGESQTIDLAPYLTPGVREAVPTVVLAQQLSNLPVQISESGSSVTIRTGAKAHGRATFRVVMSDVAGSSRADRRVEGRITLDILGVPAVPGVPVPVKQYFSEKISLDWRAPQSNGAPIDFYEVRDQRGRVQRCRTSSCDITGLTNGLTYRFTVRAHNAVGFSDWSGASVPWMPDEPIDLNGSIKLIDRGDGFLHIDWDPVETKSGGEVTYIVRWVGGDPLQTTTSEARIEGLDNHLKYQFIVRARNLLNIGVGLKSEKFQPIGPPSIPQPPALTDQETPGSTGAVSLTWDAVDANGPTPVRYTVFRDGSAVAACTNKTDRSCDMSGMAYNGHVYSFSVQATNDNGKGVESAVGPATQWRATGKPASWGTWDLKPTGNNNEARATFTVPSSRGDESSVRVYVDETKVLQFAGTGSISRTFDVPNNLGPHSVNLEVCNEGGACTQSASQSVQTFGPISPGHIHQVTPIIGGPDGRQISWAIEVDSNGDPATLTVTSDKRSESFTVPVGVSTVTTQAIELDYRTTETVTVTLSDGSPPRGSTSTTSSGTTAPPPPPSVTLSKGPACNDDPAAGLQPCNTNGFAGEDCTSPSCAFIVVTLTNFDSDVSCNFSASQGTVGGQGALTSYPNGTSVTAAYYGFSSASIQATCRSLSGQQAQSDLYTWP
jgi:hypothetical protein